MFLLHHNSTLLLQLQKKRSNNADRKHKTNLWTQVHRTLTAFTAYWMPCQNNLLNVDTFGKTAGWTFSYIASQSFQVVSHNLLPTKSWMSAPYCRPISLSSAVPLWENPGNSLISACVNARIVYGGMESPLGMSRHPRRPDCARRLEWDAYSH